MTIQDEQSSFMSTTKLFIFSSSSFGLAFLLQFLLDFAFPPSAADLALCLPQRGALLVFGAFLLSILGVGSWLAAVILVLHGKNGL